MAHTKETQVFKYNTFEEWRQRTNKISYDLGAVTELHQDLTDSIFEFTAAAGQRFFYDGNLQIQYAPGATLDNTAGSIILTGSPTIDPLMIADERIFQGPEVSKTWEATIVSISDEKILVKNSTGNFSSSEDIVLQDDTDVILDSDNIASIIAESYNVVYTDVEVDTVEYPQTLTTVGFHAPTYNGRIALTGSPTIPDAMVEGATVYQGTIGSETFKATVLFVEGSSQVHIKNVITGNFSNAVMLKVGDGVTPNRILAANLGTYTTIPQDHACMIELNTPATAGQEVHLHYYSLVGSINELQTDIGTVENLTTTATNLVGAVNELDAEIGDTSEFSSVSATNNTASTAIAQLHTEIGDITTLDNLFTNDTNLTDALNELQGDIGNVGSLTTTATTAVTAINEHETNIGDMTFTGLDADNISAAIRELRTDIGDVTATNMGTSSANLTGAMLELETEIDTLNTRVEPTQAFHANFTSTTIMDGINELMTDIGDVTAANMGTEATTVVTAISELEGEIDNLITYTDYNTTLETTANSLADAINEHEGDIGNMTFTGLAATDISAAIRELRTDIGDVTAANMGTTSTNLVGALNEVENEVDTLNARVEPTQAFNAFFGSTTIMDALNELATESVMLSSTTDQALSSNFSLSTGKTFTIDSGATLDINGTLNIGGGAGSDLQFDTAFLTLASTSAIEGIQIDRSEIADVTVATEVDSQVRWNEGLVATVPHRAWEIKGLTNDATPVASTSSIVTFYNAKDLVSSNTETNITVGWDATNQNFDFALNNNISITGATFSGTATANHVATATMTATGNVTIEGDLTVNGTSTIINTETLKVDDNIIVLNDNVTGTPTENAGIEVERGTGNNVLLRWNEADDRWGFTNNGSTYYNIPVPSEYDNYSSWTIRDGDSSTYTITSGDTLQIAEGNGINSNFTADDVLTITNTKPFDYLTFKDDDGTSLNRANTSILEFKEGTAAGASIDINFDATNTNQLKFTVTNTDRGSSQHIFKTITVDTDGQADVVADSNSDTLNLIGGNAVTLSTNATTDTITIAHDDTSTLSGSYGGNNNGVVIEDITVDGNGHITAIGTRDLDSRYDNYANWSLFVDGVDKDDVTSGEKVDFAATAPLSVAHTVSDGNVLTFTHDDSGVTAGTYGQSGAEDGTYIKSVTVNAKGHVTAISSDDFDDRYNKYAHPNHTGDVTSTGDGATVIANDAVTYAKMQNMTTARILGRNTAESGDVEELTAATVRSMINVANGANNYSLPVATATALGGIELFSNTDQTVAANSITTATGRTYGIQLNSANQAVVNVPWTDTLYTLPLATDTVRGGIELFSNTDQATAANSVTSTAGRTYGIQLNSANQAVVNVPWTDTVYSLPEATATTRGGIELFSNTDQTVAANAVSATAGRTYGVQLNSAGQAVVNVPWVDTDTNTTYSVGDGGLTQKNFTTTLKDKLDGIASNATNTADPAISNYSGVPYLTGGITAEEVRTLIGAGTATVNDTGTPAILITGSSGGAVPALNTGISALEMRQLIGAGTTTLDGQSGTAPYYGARAWFNVIYQVADGYVITVTGPTLNAGGNISSVTMANSSTATINFTTSMPTANYAVSVSGNRYATSTTSNNGGIITGIFSPSTSAFTISFYDKVDTTDAGNRQAPSTFSGIVMC